MTRTELNALLAAATKRMISERKTIKLPTGVLKTSTFVREVYDLPTGETVRIVEDRLYDGPSNRNHCTYRLEVAA
jgi:hypothetical protein